MASYVAMRPRMPSKLSLLAMLASFCPSTQRYRVAVTDQATSLIGRGSTLWSNTVDVPTCRPSPELVEDLDLLLDEGEYVALDYSPPIDTGILVDGEPWGWFWTISDRDEQAHWELLPLDFQEVATTVIEVGAWQSMSMTGAVLTAGARQVGGLAVRWSRDDEGYRDLVVDRAFDAEDAAHELCSDLFDGGDPVCPDTEEHGWEITLDLADSISHGTAAKCLDIIWKPCGEDPLHDELTFRGSRWHWDGDHWRLRG